MICTFKDLRILLTGFLYIRGLGTFRPLDNLELDWISFLQGAVAISKYGRVVNEDVGAIIASDEAVAFRVVEPFYSPEHVR